MSVEPAMTPEEWAKGLPGIYGWDDGSVFIDWRNDPANIDRPHAIAAVCLYGQPFGFTREDVVALRGAAGMIEDRACTAREHEVGESLRSLIDRIEAFLPPE